MLTVAHYASALVIGVALLGGCKKETPQKTEAPQTAPAPAPVSEQQAKSGEALFTQHCAACHPDGGNVVKAEYTLHNKALAAHDITKPADIVKKMRNPGPGMTKFDETALPDSDATAIAQYVIDTFK